MHVTVRECKKNLQGGASLMQSHGSSIEKAILSAFPHMTPLSSLFCCTLPMRVGEKKFRSAVERLFSLTSSEILYNTKRLINTEVNGKKIHSEVDVWIPSLNIGFEYQVIFSISLCLA